VVVDRYWSDVSERVIASLGDRVGPIGPDMARATADALLTAIESDAALLRVIFEELPPRRLREQRAALVRRVHQLTTALLSAQSGETAAPRLRAWIVVIAVENVTIRWVLDKPDGIDRDQLIDELTTLVLRYLAGNR
jgi:phenylpyruvate tautomerase PptA (4-oxalocrotonate tautomerase family)